MDRGAWRATVHGVTNESDTTERLNATKQQQHQQCGQIEQNNKESNIFLFHPNVSSFTTYKHTHTHTHTQQLPLLELLLNLNKKKNILF